MAKASRAAKAAADVGVLEKIIGSVTAKHGPDALRRVGDRPRKKYEVIKTGSIGLDMAVGVGGLPRGRIHEVYGDSGTGKTTLMLHLTAEAQAAGLSVAFIDAEHALDLDYAEKLGVDVDNLLLCQPDSGEQALNVCAEICEAAAEQEGKNGVPGLVIVDSVAALVPEKELEGDNEDSSMGLMARMMGKGIRKIVAAAAKGNVCVVFINQTRMKLGVVFGNPETTTGGNALKFFATIRLRTGSSGFIDKAGDREGRRVNVKVEKNKVGTPFRTVEYDIMFGAGIDHAGELIDHGVARGIITTAGTRLSFNGKEIANGRPNSKLKLNEDTALAAAIETEVLKHMDAHGLVLPAKTAKADKGKKGAKDEPTTPHDPETGEVTE